MLTRSAILSGLGAAILVAATANSSAHARGGAWFVHQTTKFMMNNGSNFSVNTLKRAREWEKRRTLSASAAASVEVPSPLPVTRDHASESMIRDGLQELGYTDIRELRCSGSVCDALAVWEGALYDLRIESDTGKIRNAA